MACQVKMAVTKDGKAARNLPCSEYYEHGMNEHIVE